jgi:Zn-dependent alcohol dehydrogenase
MEASAIPIPDDVSFEVAAIIGCAVITGVGAVINTGQAKAGRSAAVIGCGGIGLSMIQGCTLAGCFPIIAVDVMESKLAFARRMGATETINASEVDVAAALRDAVRLGPHYVFDSVGAPITIQQALTAVRPGGSAVIAGMHSMKQEVPIPAAALIAQNKRLLGSFVGSANPKLDLPMLVELYRAGKLQLDELISKRYPLDALPQAFDDMQSGAVARGVLVFD